MEKLEGAVDSIIFSSTDGNFTVFRLRPESRQSTVVVTARTEAPLLGQQLAFAANAAQQGAGAVEGTQKKMARCRGPKARGVSAGGPVHRRGMVGAEGFGCAVKGFVAQ